MVEDHIFQKEELAERADNGTSSKETNSVIKVYETI